METPANHNKKKLLLDTSSAILLYKAGLHSLLTFQYQVIMPVSVFCETTKQRRTGSKAYRQLSEEKKIAVKEVSCSTSYRDSGLLRLDQGERDCLILFLGGKADFVVTDDGAAAKYCRKHCVPFVNALLIPRILAFAGVKSDICYEAAYERICAEGRYARAIKNYAATIAKDNLRTFFPV